MAEHISRALETAAAVGNASAYFSNAGLTNLVDGIDYLNRYNQGILSNDLSAADYERMGKKQREILEDECRGLYFTGLEFAHATAMPHEPASIDESLASLESLRKYTEVAQRIASVPLPRLQTQIGQPNHIAYSRALTFASASIRAFVVIHANFGYPDEKAMYYSNNIDQGLSEIRAGVRYTEEALVNAS